MKVTQVVVEIHEKRANPSAMGHYDANVAYTVQVDEGDNAEAIVSSYQYLARQHVADECDRWEREIKLEEERGNARNDLRWIVERAGNRSPSDNDTKELESKVALLPSEEQTEWRTKLTAAIAAYQAEMRAHLDKLINKATHKEVSQGDAARFDSFMLELAEDDRAGYIDRMSDAIAAYELSQAAQTTMATSDEPTVIGGVGFSIEVDNDEPGITF